jgi:glycerate 2-kinase
MKILVAPDKFKGTSTAQGVADTLNKLIQKQRSSAFVRICPVADGGDGTLQAVIHILKGKMVDIHAHDPLMRSHATTFGLTELPEKNSALIEMAQVSGLSKLTASERNPLLTTSYGTGELVVEAYKRGARHIRLALGGSATIDGGLGFLQALGAKIYAKAELPKGAGGQHLSHIVKINLEPIHKNLKDLHLTGLADVRVQLLGEFGSARFFGPQKGATPSMIEELEKGMAHFEKILAETSGVSLKNHRGAGAAGGMGMALLALGGKLDLGFDFVADTLKLESQMKGCDLVITGEGMMDASSLEGKAPVAVALMAKKLGIPCVAIVGALDPNIIWLNEVGISKVYPLFDKPISADDERVSQIPDRFNDAVHRLLKDFPEKL